MNFKIVKVVASILGALLVGALALFGFLVFDSGKSKDYLLQQKVSPDGKLIAELHQT